MFTLPALAVGCKPNEQLELVPAEPSVETKIATITEPSADAFDWSRDDSIVVEEQPSIAIFLNSRNHVVIRQRGYSSEDEDEFVTIAPQNLMAVIDRLCDLAGIPSVGKRRK